MTIGCFERIRPANSASGLIFLCDHAANAVPEAYDRLGLPPELYASHIAYDIGAATLVREMAKKFASAAILGCWSRLLIDLNRGKDDPTLIMQLSDGSIIPGNRGLGVDEITHRICTYYAPYHGAIAAEIARIESQNVVPVLLSIHSFTPVWKGHKRSWDVGVLWDRDGRLAIPLMAALRQAGFTVGDNEPYAGGLKGDTLDRHGTENGLPHVLLEVRQDLLGSAVQIAATASRLEPVLRAALLAAGPAKRLNGIE